MKITDKGAYLFESRLKRVVELNFTMGFHHQDGKHAVTSALKRIVTGYGGPGPDSLSLASITSPNQGTGFYGGVGDFDRYTEGSPFP